MNDALKKVTTLLLKHVYDVDDRVCNEGPARFPWSSALDSPKMAKYVIRYIRPCEHSYGIG